MELLVVIAIIGVLIAMLLPAVQSAREAARNSQCRNHVKQLALGCLLHESTHGILPDGGEGVWVRRSRVAGTNAIAVAPNQHWGWAYQILPFVEHQAVWEIEDDAQVSHNIIPIHYCPSRRPPKLVPNLGNGPAWAHFNRRTPWMRGMIDYAGNAGTSCRNISGWGIRGQGLDATIVRRPNGAKHPNGLPQRSQSVKFAVITDGTSNTLLLGEKLMNAEKVGTEDLGDDDSGFVEGWDFDTVRWGCYPPGPDIRDPAMPAHQRRYAAQRGGFGASHPAHFNAALCDGSVRKVSFDVDFNLFKNLSSRDDGNTQVPE